MPTINYQGLNQSIETTDEGATLLDVSIENRIPHLHECGGNGQCTTCRIRVLDGIKNLSPRGKGEAEIAKKRRWDPTIRLACLCTAHGDVNIQRLIWSSAEINKLQLETLPEGNGEERKIAIICCDLRNFTQMTSQNLVYDMVHMLNRFYTLLGDPILMNNGIIYQYVGDEIIGVFGTAGGSNESNCEDAIRAALGMRYALERLNKFELEDLDAKLEIGIGLHFGEAYMGHMGHPKHRQFAVIGDPINITSRVQDFTKQSDTNILISEDFLSNLPSGLLNLGSSYKTNLKGKDSDTTLYEVNSFRNADMNLELQASLDLLLKNQERFAKNFYLNLFNESPDLRQLFKGNMENQGKLLMHMLGGIVYSLTRPGHLKLGLRSLGKNHQKYGVKKEHYPIVKRILLNTIKQELGEDHNKNIFDSWSKAIDIVMSYMQPLSDN
jgi:class 3 adenylate cyclase